MNCKWDKKIWAVFLAFQLVLLPAPDFAWADEPLEVAIPSLPGEETLEEAQAEIPEEEVDQEENTTKFLENETPLSHSEIEEFRSALSGSQLDSFNNFTKSLTGDIQWYFIPLDADGNPDQEAIDALPLKLGDKLLLWTSESENGEPVAVAVVDSEIVEEEFEEIEDEVIADEEDEDIDSEEIEEEDINPDSEENENVMPQDLAQYAGQYEGFVIREDGQIIVQGALFPNSKTLMDLPENLRAEVRRRLQEFTNDNPPPPSLDNEALRLPRLPVDDGDELDVPEEVEENNEPQEIEEEENRAIDGETIEDWKQSVRDAHLDAISFTEPIAADPETYIVDEGIIVDRLLMDIDEKNGGWIFAYVKNQDADEAVEEAEEVADEIEEAADEVVEEVEEVVDEIEEAGETTDEAMEEAIEEIADEVVEADEEESFEEQVERLQKQTAVLAVISGQNSNTDLLNPSGSSVISSDDSDGQQRRRHRRGRRLAWQYTVLGR